MVSHWLCTLRHVSGVRVPSPHYMGLGPSGPTQYPTRMTGTVVTSPIHLTKPNGTKSRPILIATATLLLQTPATEKYLTWNANCNWREREVYLTLVLVRQHEERIGGKRECISSWNWCASMMNEKWIWQFLFYDHSSLAI